MTIERWAARSAGLTVALAAAALFAAGEARAQLSPSDQSVLLDEHNALRSEVALGQLAGQPPAANMTGLVWDVGVAQTAQSWANQCNFSHNPGRGNVGENLFLGTGALTPAILKQGVDLWFAENTSFTYGPINGTAGHYTQVVWAATLSVGCGATFCPSVTNEGGITNATLLVCDYAPPGNFIGEAPYVSGTACSQCPAGRGSCSAGLCVAPTAVPAVPPFGAWILALLLLGAAGLGVPRSRGRRQFVTSPSQ